MLLDLTGALPCPPLTLLLSFPLSCSANVKRKLYLSDSVWAVIRTNILVENAWLTNKPKEQTSVQFYHQRTLDQSSTLSVAYDHLSASHMQKNRREPLWTSLAAWLGFRPGHLEPHKVDVKYGSSLYVSILYPCI